MLGLSISHLCAANSILSMAISWSVFYRTPRLDFVHTTDLHLRSLQYMFNGLKLYLVRLERFHCDRGMVESSKSYRIQIDICTE